MNLMQFIAKQNAPVIYPQMGGVGLGYTPYTMYDVYRDPLKQLEIAHIHESRFPVDFSYPLDYGVVFTEALGIPLLRPDYDFPSSQDHPIRTLEDLYALKQPDPLRDGLMPEYLESIRLISCNIDKPQMVALVGPYTLAGELIGVENLMRSTLKHPEFIEALMDFAEEAVLRFARLAVAAGGKALQISEPTAGLISPSAFSRLITPRLQRIFSGVKAKGGWGVLHICGDTRRLMKEMIQTGAEALSLDQIMPMADVAEALPREIILAGNVDPCDIMLHGSTEDVRRVTEKLISDMRPYPNFMPSFGCDCPIGSPEENIRAFISTVYGELR